MNRREFIILAQGVGLTAWFGDIAFAQANGALVMRKSATTSAAAADIEVLRKGVKALLDVTDATRYASWMYWANSHCTRDEIPPQMKNVWCQCAHTPSEGPLNLNFLPWHRAYLFFFEALIRELTEQPGFALPYWDWYASKTIPPAFTGGASNPLSWKVRRGSKQTLLQMALRQSSFNDFSEILEGNPHGTVHVMVGGDMGSVPTSARDPVFWAHHGNIDRLWSVWLASDTTRTNPGDAEWKAQSFAFDLAGQKHITVAELLNTEDLGYKYDNLQPAGAPDALPTPPAAQKTATPTPNMTLMSEAQPQALTTTSQVALGSSLGLTMKVPPLARSRLSAMATGPSAESPKLALVLAGLHVTDAGRTRGFEYRIYLNLPSKPSTEDKHDDFFVGIINSFQLSHHVSDQTVLVFPIERLAPALSKRGRWNPDEVKIALITDDKDVKEPLLKIDYAGLVLARTPITPEAAKSLSQ